MNIVLNVNKPRGLTSQQAVSRVKKILGVKKAGHAGTLDPLATGVLVVCVGEATKITRFLAGQDKRYSARIKLGERTDTYDSQGRVIETRDISGLTVNDIIAVTGSFAGKITQKPPMFSAVKIDGAPLYKLARKGINIERPDRAVTIHDICITSTDIPFFDLDIACSKGTYIRTLAEDIGQRLGTGAHLVALERKASGFFTIEKSATFDDLQAWDGMSSVECATSIDEAISFMPHIQLDETETVQAKNGVKINYNKINMLQSQDYFRIKDSHGFLFAIGSLNDRKIRVERLLKI